MVDHIPAKHLLLTSQAEQWLENFTEEDRGLARELASALVLVSHNAFERELTALIHKVAQEVVGPIALYAAREVGSDYDPLNEGVVDATPRGPDIGSEGRMASIIRNISREEPQKFLNHPTLNELRTKRADAIFVLDDFIGSGKRCSEYLSALWASRTLRSWKSYHLVQLCSIAYSGTSEGVERVRQHPCHPTIYFARHCPTIDNLHWRNARIEAAKDLCRRYSRRAKLNWALGFRRTASLLIFEHGCPNNVPSIFWSTSSEGRAWIPLFPSNRIRAPIASAFPAELSRPDPVSVLVEAGQRRLAAALAVKAHRPLSDQEALTLALFAKGKKRDETVANVLAVSPSEAVALIERCIAAGWVTPRRRITDSGLAELRGIRSASIRRGRPLPDLGEEVYYPSALRDRGNG